MKQFLFLGISILAVSACAPQASPPGSPTNTTRAFDGDYGKALLRNVTSGCPDFVSGRAMTIRNGLATFQSAAPAQGYRNSCHGYS